MKILSADLRHTGVPSGPEEPCPHCAGTRIPVAWEDGLVTKVCLAQVKQLEEGVVQIGIEGNGISAPATPSREKTKEKDDEERCLEKDT